MCQRPAAHGLLPTSAAQGKHFVQRALGQLLRYLAHVQVGHGAVYVGMP